MLEWEEKKSGEQLWTMWRENQLASVMRRENKFNSIKLQKTKIINKFSRLIFSKLHTQKYSQKFIYKFIHRIKSRMNTNLAKNNINMFDPHSHQSTLNNNSTQLTYQQFSINNGKIILKHVQAIKKTFPNT